MKKEFYIGQPLIVKETGEKVTFAHDDNTQLPCNILRKVDGGIQEDFYKYEQVEPSTEFKFSEIIAGLEQGYFEVETEFRIPNDIITMTVRQGNNGLLLERFGEHLILTSKKINSTWQLVEPHKEMTLEEIEDELGYKIKLKDNGGN